MRYLIGTDIGTSGTKTVLFDERGKICAAAEAGYPLYQPRAGWAEQSPEDWWEASAKTIAEVVKKSGADPRQIAGVGLSGQMHGLVMLDADGNVLRKSIIWCDQRTGEECDILTRRVGGKRVIEITANPVLTGFTASKILWVQRNEPEIWQKCARVLLPKDYVRYRLTGEFATEVSDASGMQLLDVPKRAWSGEMLDALGMDERMLGKVYESCEISGRVSPKAAELTGLAASTPVGGGAGDQAAAAVGNGIVESGAASCNIGSSGVVFAHTDTLKIDPKGRVHTFCHAVPGCWHVMGVTQGAGLSMKWFKDNFYSLEAERGGEVYDLVNADVAKVPPGCEGLIYLPYLMGERTPHLDPDARGVFFGITARHGKPHFSRAVMEGVSYSLLDCLGVIRELGVEAFGVRLCGGGAKSPIWRQMIADMFEMPAALTNSSEAGALGVAILAGVGAGVYASVPAACRSVIRETGSIVPGKDAGAYPANYKIYRELYPILKNTYKELKSC